MGSKHNFIICLELFLGLAMMITSMMILTNLFTPLMVLELETKMDPAFSPVHRGLELPQLILQLTASFLRGHLPPVVGPGMNISNIG